MRAKLLCKKCNNFISKSNYFKHFKKCNGVPSWFIRKTNNLPIKVNLKIKDVNWQEIQEFYNNKHSFMDVCKKYNFTTYFLSKAVKQKLLITRSKTDTARIRDKFKNCKIPQDVRQKISISMRKAVLEGRQKTPKPYGKYCKLYEGINWKGKIEILQGGCEKIVADFLTKEQIKWERPVQSFTYIFKNKQHEYFPDFYLPDYNVYIEVKGRVQEKDLSKWKYFTKKLLVIDKDSIYNLKQFFDKNLKGW